MERLGDFLDAKASQALAPVTYQQVQRSAHQNSSLLIGCHMHTTFLLDDVILIVVEHSRRF